MKWRQQIASARKEGGKPECYLHPRAIGDEKYSVIAFKRARFTNRRSEINESIVTIEKEKTVRALPSVTQTSIETQSFLIGQSFIFCSRGDNT